MKPIKQTVYLSVNGESELYIANDNTGGYIEGVIEQEGYFFTPEQLNQYTKTVGKAFLESGAEKAISEPFFIDGEPAYMSDRSPVDKQSITNTFEETFKQFKV